MPSQLPESLLYHGSAVEVQSVDLAKSAPKKDFGEGFYTTSRRQQAEKFAILKARRLGLSYGAVSVFSYKEKSGLDILRFESANLEWLDFILLNRGFTKADNPNITHAEPASRKINNAHKHDIVIGPVANDAVGVVLNQLVIGTYGDPFTAEARLTAIRLLESENLYDQVFFGSQKSVLCLDFKEAFVVAAH
jgi:hypothetical protein